MDHIPIRNLSQREIVQRLRELIDHIMDPAYRIKQPDAFAQDYHILLSIVTRQPNQVTTKYVIHNIGQERARFVLDLISREGAA